MRNSDLSKVNVKIVKPYTETEPVSFRRYTVKHLEDPSIVNLSVAPYFYDLDLSTVSTNLIYGQWYLFIPDIYQLTVYAFVGNYPYDVSKYRYEKFLELLPSSISSIVNGDIEFLENRPPLLETPVLVRFISMYPEFNKTVPYGRIRDYLDEDVEVNVVVSD